MLLEVILHSRRLRRGGAGRRGLATDQEVVVLGYSIGLGRVVGGHHEVGVREGRRRSFVSCRTPRQD